jgi:hypothetical protein
VFIFLFSLQLAAFFVIHHTFCASLHSFQFAALFAAYLMQRATGCMIAAESPGKDSFMGSFAG